MTHSNFGDIRERANRLFLALVAIALAATPCRMAAADEYISGMKWEEPVMVTPGKTSADPPSDAVILFDGKDLSAWNGGEKWKIENGEAVVGGGEISTKQEFGDCQLHIEWSSPVPAKGSSQGRGNSGIFFQSRYELQILDSFENQTYFDGQASTEIYKQTPPMVNAMRKPGEWNTYDVVFNAPKFKDDGSVESPAYITVLHNGVLTLNHFEIQGETPFDTPPAYHKHGKGPIKLQDHGNPVRFRNIWLREIKPVEGKREKEPFMRDPSGKERPVDKNATNVRGNISIDGNPVQQASIQFTSPNGKYASRVRDGKFQITNVKPGQYTVTIRPNKKAARSANIPQRYRSPEQSGLAATVEDGQNELALEINSK